MIAERMEKKIAEVTRESETALLLLIAIQSVDWKSLPVDTLLYVGDGLASLRDRKEKAYFSHISAKDSYNESAFCCYPNGRTSLTHSDALGFSRWIYAIPCKLLDLALA